MTPRTSENRLNNGRRTFRQQRNGVAHRESNWRVVIPAALVVCGCSGGADDSASQGEGSGGTPSGTGGYAAVAGFSGSQFGAGGTAPGSGGAVGTGGSATSAG